MLRACQMKIYYRCIMNKKSIIYFLIVSIMTLALLLSACGGKNKGGNEDANTEGVSQEDIITDEGDESTSDDDYVEDGEDDGDAIDFPFLDF